MATMAERCRRRRAKMWFCQMRIQDEFIEGLRDTGKLMFASLAGDFEARELLDDCPEDSALISEAHKRATAVILEAVSKPIPLPESGT